VVNKLILSICCGPGGARGFFQNQTKMIHVGYVFRYQGATIEGCCSYPHQTDPVIDEQIRQDHTRKYEQLARQHEFTMLQDDPISLRVLSPEEAQEWA